MVRSRFLVRKSGCEVCNAPLLYNTEITRLSCYYCEKEFDADVYCSNGHYVCDACLRVDANDLIVKFCLNYNGINPIELSNDIMQQPVFNMHGPEHHFLVPAVLFICYNNLNFITCNPEKVLQLLRSRMVKIPGGICATHGGCGAVLGLGAFISYITSVTPLSGKIWADVHSATGAALMDVSKYGGPRCCKRNVYIAILAGIHWLAESRGVMLEGVPEINCSFHSMDSDCIKKRCLFFKST